MSFAIVPMPVFDFLCGKFDMKKMIFLTALAVSAPAYAERVAQTPSGQVEGIYLNTTQEAAISNISSKCMDAGMPVQRTDYSVKCQRVMSKLEQAFQNALTSPRYASDSKDVVEFNLVQIEKNTRVQLRRWQEYTTAFGQYNQISLDNENFYNESFNFLLHTGATYIIGTTFPNTSYLGVGWKQSVSSVGTKKFKGLEVVEVDKGSPSHIAGLTAGDLIVAINEKPVSSYGATVKAIDRVPLGQTFSMRVVRNSNFVDLRILAQKRQDVTSYDQEPQYLAPESVSKTGQ